MNSRRPFTAAAALALAALACQTVAVTPTPASAPTARPTITPAVAAPTPADRPTEAGPAISGLSRSAPFPAGAPAELPGWTVEVREVVRGEQAWRQLRQANQFNTPPAEGQEYLLVRLRVTATHGDSSPRPVQAADFKVTGSAGRRYFKASAVTPEPALEADLQDGESAEGWSVYLVTPGETDLLLMVEPLEGPLAEAPRFLALEAGAAVGVDAGLAAIDPTRLGADSAEPAPLRRTVVTEDWELAALAVVRGEAAWSLVVAANQFNDPPAAGLEYAVVQVHARLIRPEDETAWIDSKDFFVLGGDGARYDIPSIVDPEPALDAVLFPGGDFTGWLTVAVPAGDLGARLVFKPWLAADDYDTRYFTLVP
ncbi:MAG: hypothetical protein JNK29_09825 [Anaerolineales bacterium]|nr:hypothetical protein [Anaerolineales bacterium]